MPFLRLAGQRGFTLMEVILVMVVGASLLFSGTVLYNTLRDSAGYTAANQKAAVLQGVIERLVTEGDGALPERAKLWDEWKKARPDSFASPWGGRATCDPNDNMGESCDTENDDSGIRDIVACAGATPCYDLSDRLPGDGGLLAYLHYNAVTIKGKETRAALNIWDNGQKAYVHKWRYAVAVINQEGGRYYNVHGPAFMYEGKPATPSALAELPGAECGCLAGVIEGGSSAGVP